MRVSASVGCSTLSCMRRIRSENSLSARIRRALFPDAELAHSLTHIHLDLRESGQRVEAFLNEPKQVQSLVLARLSERVERLSPGLRVGGLSFIATALTSGGVLIATFGIALFSGMLGALVASVDATGHFDAADGEVLQQFLRGSMFTVVGVVAVLALIGWGVYWWQRTHDDSRAISVAWLRLYEEALVTRPATTAPPTAGWRRLLLPLRPRRRSAGAGERPPTP